MLWHSCVRPSVAAAFVYVLLVCCLATQAHAAIPVQSRGAWLALLHYWGGERRWRSEVEDRAFFLDVDGASDPDGEWEADRRAFLASVDEEHFDRHARCRFPARFVLMKASLGWKDDELPHIDCREFAAHEQRLHATSLSVIFVSYNIENPASAFGHTMLYLGSGTERGAVLADYSVSFETNTQGMSPAQYLPRGLLGGLSAGFRVAPLYERVHRYEREEQRDLWILPIEMRRDEIDQLVRHLWELKDVTFRYGFFGGNCAQKLLAIVQAVAPEYEVLPYQRVAVLPAEVGRRLVEKIGLAGEPLHRSSLSSQYGRQVAKLSQLERVQLEEMVASRAVAEDASPATLSAALSWSELATPNRSFRRAADTAPDPDHVWRRKLLTARVAAGFENGEPPRPEIDRSLLQAHRPSRLTLSGGFRSNTGSVLGVSARWLLHEAIDPPNAYPPISSVEVARVDAGVTSRRKVFVDEATLLRVERLGPSSDLQSALAWRLEVGVRRLAQSADAALHLGAELDIGVGTSLGRTGYSASVYSMVGIRPGATLVGGAGTFLPAGIWSGGILLQLPANVRVQTAGEYAVSLRSLTGGAASFKSVARMLLARDLEFELSAIHRPVSSSIGFGVVSFR